MDPYQEIQILKPMKNRYYITTAILYTNGKPHIGFALELIQADVLARYHRLKGEDVHFLTGTDEHGSSVTRAAEKLGKEPQELADEVSLQAEDLTQRLNVANDDFIRTSDKVRHWPSVIKLWSRLLENGDLYKKEYEGLYCVGHEAFIKKSDLIDGICPLHKTQPEVVKEENWFFRLTKYKNEVRKKIESGALKILPNSKINELLNLLDDAEDVSFSRPMSSLKWGIPVPNDPTQTMYVWADALTNYISALGWDHDGEDFKRYWPADVHLVGKDILRFHAMVWPAMLLSLGLELPKSVYVHGFINVDGQKMSKTIGNVIDPFEVVEKFGPEVTRYYLLREISSTEDGDFSEKKLIDRYNGDLANGLGNLTSRVVTLIGKSLDGELVYKEEYLDTSVALKISEVWADYDKAVENFKLHEALASVWSLIGFADKYMNDRQPWKSTDPKELLTTMTNLVMILHNITRLLLPFMPSTAEKIMHVLGLEPGVDPVENFKFVVEKSGPLFPRLD